MLHYNTVMFKKSLEFFCKVLKGAEKISLRKELQENKKMELRTWYFPFPLYCIVNKSTHFLRNYLTNEKRFKVLFPFYQQYIPNIENC